MPVLRVAFCHPDLGLGGAERLVVDAAVELADHGHLVDVYTAHHDPKRCFKETVDGPFTVLVAGNWFPRHVLGALHALCAYIRCLLAACYIVWRSYRLQTQYDVIIVDQVSVVLPVLRWTTQAKVLFYCHFPDLLLVQRRSFLRSIYRWPLNAAEELTTGQADKLLVNSQFTQGVFAETFTSLAKRGIVPDVLYPAVPVPSNQELQTARDSWPSMVDEGLCSFLQEHTVFLSINRFERKKDLALAVLAFSALQKRLGLRSTAAAVTRLVLAGGYDTRLAENREYFQELKQLVQQLGLEQQVWLLRSFSDQQRTALLAACHAVVYTPQREHFGIVPLEAMASSRPVIACNSGGPMESVLHGKTGFLCEPLPEQFAAAMATLLEDKAVKDMGNAARSHVMKTFSRTAFGNKLHTIVSDLCRHRASI